MSPATVTLLERYRQACPETVRRGREWYDEARRECARIARETGYSRKQVAAVLAITSPDAQLATNIEWTRDICHGRRESMAGRYPKDQAPKVRAALQDRRDPGQYATGPKVSAFYAAILGDDDTLVIDRWASFAAGGPKDRVPGVRERRTFADAYRAAAEIVGETVRDFQAIVWIVCRETTPRADGRINRLADITA